MSASVSEWANNAAATLAAGITSSQTTITLTSGQGATFPALASGEFFVITIQSVSNVNTYEIAYCTARSSDTLTVTRGQEGTTGQAFNAGDTVQNRPTAGTYAGFVQWAATGLQSVHWRGNLDLYGATWRLQVGHRSMGARWWRRRLFQCQWLRLCWRLPSSVLMPKRRIKGG